PLLKGSNILIPQSFLKKIFARFFCMIQPIAINELGETTLSVAEPLKEALASARLLAEREA
ncbi:hypothetical protein, partial [Leptospira soteropolitanensis]